MPASSATAIAAAAVLLGSPGPATSVSSPLAPRLRQPLPPRCVGGEGGGGRCGLPICCADGTSYTRGAYSASDSQSSPPPLGTPLRRRPRTPAASSPASPPPPPRARLPGTASLTVLIPALNEASRLPPTLDATLAYLTLTRSGPWEVVVIDDGSTDGTAELVHRRMVEAASGAADRMHRHTTEARQRVGRWEGRRARVEDGVGGMPESEGKGAAAARSWAGGIPHCSGNARGAKLTERGHSLEPSAGGLRTQAPNTTRLAEQEQRTRPPTHRHALPAYPRLRLISSGHGRNGGKGAALAAGAAAARGDLVLFMDADGATDLRCLPALERRVYRRGCQIAVGCRAAAMADRPAGRRLMGFVFGQLAGALVPGVPDTQCGFKLLSRAAADSLMPRLRIRGWAYDVDLLGMAIADGMRVASVPVRWRDVAGSKVRPSTPVAMLADLAWLFGERLFGSSCIERLFRERRAVAAKDECLGTEASTTRQASAAGSPQSVVAAIGTGPVGYSEVYVGAETGAGALGCAAGGAEALSGASDEGEGSGGVPRREAGAQRRLGEGRKSRFVRVGMRGASGRRQVRVRAVNSD